MPSDAAMVNVSAPALAKDTGKKKKNNRSARLKQCKLDARRDQWLLQVKNNGCKLMSENMKFRPLPLSGVGKQDGSWGESIIMKTPNERTTHLDDLHDTDSESLFSSPTSSSSGTNYSMKNCLADCGSSYSSTSSRSYSRHVMEDKEDEGESGGEEDVNPDDWEAVADALTASNKTQDHSKSETVVIPIVPTAHSWLPKNNCSRGILKKPEANRSVLRAWRADDEFRPQSLPSLSKFRSFSVNKERKFGNHNIGWTNEFLVNEPSLCPICYEDLDLTDTSFLPCSCGFHLCLFCHKRILEDDGRCPGCRKQYALDAGVETIMNGGSIQPSCHMSLSCNMGSRS